MKYLVFKFLATANWSLFLTGQPHLEIKTKTVTNYTNFHKKTSKINFNWF